jgi:hypothetical protein
LQSAVFTGGGKVAFLANGLAIEIHHADLAIEARDPDLVCSHAGTPADAVHAHADESGDRRRERGPVRSKLDRTASNAVNDTGLRAKQPVLAAPPLMNRAEVNAEATVVSSLTITRAGGCAPSTDSKESAGLGPLATI